MPGDVCLPRGCVSAQRGVGLLKGCRSAQGCVGLPRGVLTPPPRADKHLGKHNFSATTVADGKK